MFESGTSGSYFKNADTFMTPVMVRPHGSSTILEHIFYFRDFPVINFDEPKILLASIAQQSTFSTDES